MPKKNYITYEPINWANGKDNGTPVNADNLNNMEQAIVALTDAVNTEVATDDIEDGAVTGAKIAQGTITKDNLDKTLGESITRAIVSTGPESIAAMEIVKIWQQGVKLHFLTRSDQEFTIDATPPW